LEKLTEILVGSLSLGSLDNRLAFLVERINDVIKPPRKATADNVNIRAMYVVNDLVNSHGGRFRSEDLALLRDLICDTPVLVGHNRSGAPLARTFHAELEEKDGVLWLKSFFYWPRGEDSAKDDLLLKIDSGLLKECSISFTYTFPECSVCGEDMRSCPHDIDFSNLDISHPHFIYNGITQVIETSLVYKGSVKGTYVTDRLSALSHTVVSDDQVRILELPENASCVLAKKDGKQVLIIRSA
jgi:hypothetical protein